MNALHAPMQQQMQQQIASDTTNRICTFITDCQAGVRQCAQAAEATLEKCLNIAHLDKAAREAQAHDAYRIVRGCGGKMCACIGRRTCSVEHIDCYLGRPFTAASHVGRQLG